MNAGWVEMEYNDLRENDRNRLNNDDSVIFVLYLIVVLWHYFFSSSMSLRFNANYFWPAIAVIGCLFFWRKIVAIKFSFYDFFIIISVMAMLATCLYSINEIGSVKYVISITIYYIVARTVSSYTRYHDLLINLMFCFCLLLCIITYIQMIFPSLYFKLFIGFLPGIYHDRIIAFMLQRAFTGFANDTSTNAFFMALGAGITWYKLMGKTKYRFAYGLLLMIFIIAELNTQRRGTTIVVIFLILLLYIGSKKHKVFAFIRYLSIAALLIYIGSFFIPAFQGIFEKFIFYSNAGDISNGRFFLWQQAFRAIAKQPLLGYGIDTYNNVFRATSAHNSYIQVFFEMGIFGVVLYFTPYIYILMKSVKYVYNKSIIFSIPIKERNLLNLSFFVQMLIVLSALFEGIFQSELSLFMLFIFQFIFLDIYQRNKQAITESDKL